MVQTFSAINVLKKQGVSRLGQETDQDGHRRTVLYSCVQIFRFSCHNRAYEIIIFFFSDVMPMDIFPMGNKRIIY